MTITGMTAVLGIVGDPIAQARTPYLMNRVIVDRDVDAVLVPFRVAAGHLDLALAGLKASGVRGAVVTMPHKRAIVRLLDMATALVNATGSCNVVRFERNGLTSGDITDGLALVAALDATGCSPQGKRAVLVGAGGAAHAIGHALVVNGVSSLLIVNRTASRAESLAADLRAIAPNITIDTSGSAAGAAVAEADLVVNTTPVGIDSHTQEMPLDLDGVGRGTVVADIVISRDRPTPFVRDAERRGCGVVTGEHMLAAQIAPMLDYMLAPAAG